MRRAKQSLPAEECAAILQNASSGVLALSGDDGYPYAVPLSFVCDGDCLYFHCAKQGHKIDAVRRSEKASFCVIAQDDVVPEDYATNYRSVIVFGRICILEDENEKRTAIEKLAVKYAPHEPADRREAAIEKDWSPLCMLKMRVEHVTGKEGLALSKKRAQK